MTAAGQEDSTVHRVIESASYLFVSESSKDFDALNGNQPAQSPPHLTTFQQADSQSDNQRESEIC